MDMKVQLTVGDSHPVFQQINLPLHLQHILLQLNLLPQIHQLLQFMEVLQMD
jgi:hypothetical protein